MITFIQKLPQDIMYHIIPYTYQLQPNVIMNDIKNYKETKELIVSLYYNYWIVNFEEAEPEDKYWLINDLVSFINRFYGFDLV
jgi:RNA recognition motif-containing protein